MTENRAKVVSPPLQETGEGDRSFSVEIGHIVAQHGVNSWALTGICGLNRCHRQPYASSLHGFECALKVRRCYEVGLHCIGKILEEFIE